MPKSRKRKKRKQARRPPGPSELQRWIPYMQRVDAAEARGDAAGALDLIMARPDGPDGEPFWRPGRVTWLLQMVLFEGMLPRWATSRWVLEQALHDLAPARRGAVHQSLGVAIDVRGGEQNLRGMNADDARVKVLDHDWVYRQHFLYDAGGLEHYLRNVATPDLVSGADRVHEWTLSQLSGFRFLARESARTTWEHLGTGDHIELPNIGSAALLLPGECAIGRLVPVEGGSIFETVPLGVPEATARAVASDPSAWVGELTEARRVSPTAVRPGGQRFGVLSDVSYLISGVTVYDDDVEPDAHPVEKARGLLRCASEAIDFDDVVDDEIVDVWPCLGAEILTPSVYLGLMDSVRRSDAGLLHCLAQRLAEPAASVCSALAVAAAEAP